MFGKIVTWVKPSDRETVDLALRETDPALHKRFVPITKGPFLALCVLVAVGIAAIPGIMCRIIAGALKDIRS